MAQVEDGYASTNYRVHYQYINNWAVKQANGEVALFLNNDTQVINADWLEETLQFAMRPDVGAVGAKLYYPDDSIQHAGVIIGIGGIAGHGHKYFPRQDPGYFHQLVLPHNVSAVTAAFLMVRNGFFWKLAVSMKSRHGHLKKGYLNIWTPYAEQYQHESKTRETEDSPEKQKRFKREIDYFKHKWSREPEEDDPYYSPNLTLKAENFRDNPNPVDISARIKRI